MKKQIPSNVEALICELNPLSKDLKYEFLGPKETFSVVNSMYLDENQDVLRWNIVNIISMDPGGYL